MKKLLKRGDRIKIKVRLISGWIGYGTVSEDQINPDGTVWFVKDGDSIDDWLANKNCVCRHEVSVCRKQNEANRS